jgi:hypothetical protein
LRPYLSKTCFYPKKFGYHKACFTKQKRLQTRYKKKQVGPYCKCLAVFPQKRKALVFPLTRNSLIMNSKPANVTFRKTRKYWNCSYFRSTISWLGNSGTWKFT